MVDSEQLRLAVETEEERRARLSNVAATKLLSLAMKMDKERKSRLEKMVTTAQLMLALTKGVVNVGVVLSLKTHSEKLLLARYLCNSILRSVLLVLLLLGFCLSSSMNMKFFCFFLGGSEAGGEPCGPVLS